MLNTIADQIHFHRRKTCAPVQDGIEHHRQVFVVFIEPAGVIAFLHHQAKAAGLAGQQRLTTCGQRRPDTPCIFCHPATDSAYRIAYRRKYSPDFLLRQPFTRIREKHLRSVCRKYRQRLPLTAGQYQFRPGSGQFVNGGSQDRRQYAIVEVDEQRRQPGRIQPHVNADPARIVLRISLINISLLRPALRQQQVTGVAINQCIQRCVFVHD
ncbi:hypothetical protein FJC61_21620 [Escherichia coli]|nr:hypothetical protein [Salmonella enterica]ECY7483277.1 hypothetical protein [Salmonella enterica subsp. enterica serovar Typhimurium]EDV8480323.1 hypothetical protein [Salmonella enterica subsp. enterica serovar Ohio]EFA3552729.1 hypothetical protein [Escherichia coli]EBD6261940.1 hypothetical protein [Salmonella enterica]